MGLSTSRIKLGAAVNLLIKKFVTEITPPAKQLQHHLIKPMMAMIYHINSRNLIDFTK